MKANKNKLEIYPDKLPDNIGINSNIKLIIKKGQSDYICWTSNDNAIATIDGDIIDIIAKSEGGVVVSIGTTKDEPLVTYEFTIRGKFKPLTTLTEDIEVELFDTAAEMFSKYVGKAMMIGKATKEIPKLYYIRKNNNPYLFEYNICGVADECKDYITDRVW